MCVFFSSWWGWWEGRWSRLNLSPADLPLVRHCLSAITTICQLKESLKSFLCTLPSRQNTFLMLLLPSPRTQDHQTQSSNKLKKNESCETRQWGYQFWQSLLSVHSHGCRFVRFWEAAPWQLNYSNYLPLNFLKCSTKVAMDHLWIHPFFFFRVSLIKQQGWLHEHVNHSSNVVCVSEMLYWMWR